MKSRGTALTSFTQPRRLHLFAWKSRIQRRGHSGLRTQI